MSLPKVEPLAALAPDGAVQVSRNSPWGVSPAVAFAVATALALLVTGQNIAFRAIENLSVSVWPPLRSQLAFWWTWVLMAPALVALARRRPIDLQRPATFLLWIGAALAFVLAHSAVYFKVRRWLGWIRPPAPPAPTPSEWYGVWATFISELAPNLMYVAAVVAAYHMAVFWQEANARRLAAARLEARVAAAELDLLRIQLHPHFLFNALNTVSSLMARDVEAARTVLADLGDLLRLALRFLERRRIRLADELDFARKYLAIQQARFRERLRVELHSEEAAEEAWVPSLVLQPLVENAIQHGVESGSSGATLTIRARQSGHRLQLVVADDGPGFDAAAGDGVGLQNTRDRLRFLYGERARLEVRNRAGGGCEAIVELPFELVAEVDHG